MTSKNLTNDQVLARWEAKEPVWTVEMGGLGAAYEQAIQEMAFASIRWMVDNPPIDGWEIMSEDQGAWRAYADACDAACSDVVALIGPSGAMHGAAMNIASVFSRKGYSSALAMVPEERLILAVKGQ